MGPRMMFFDILVQISPKMKKHYAYVTALAMTIASISDAQTLTEASNAPVAGDVLNYHGAPYAAPTAPGTGQTWDLSSLQSSQSTTVTYVTPASTGHAATFPNANLAANDGQGGYQFYVTSAAGFEVAGAYSSNGPVAIPYQNPERIISYPCSYGTTWTDPFSSNYTSGGVATVRSGSITGHADATGTLIMPYGMVSNVIRIHTNEVYSDVNEFFTIEYDFNNYYYFTPGVHAPLYVTYDMVTTVNGFPQTSQMASWTTDNSTGMSEALANAIGIDVFPNPASDQMAVIYSSNGSTTTMQVIDATGRTVRSEDLGAVAIGIARADISVADLAPGAYLLRIIASNGEQGTKRLVIQ